MGETGDPAPHAGQFVVECLYSHSAPDDPIVFPGEPGLSHLHDFFGNTTTDADTTAESLGLGDTTCTNRQDRASYWAPALLADGVKIDPVSSDSYYKAGPGVDPSDVVAYPEGLRMISGDAAATEPLDTDVVGFSCARLPHVDPTPRDCEPGSPMTVRVTFPDCWDGRNVDSEDHRSHMAHSGAGGCPGSHPVAVPQLEFVVYYEYDGDPADLRLAAGPPRTAHADFFNAWDPDALAKEIRGCLHIDIECNIPLAEQV